MIDVCGFADLVVAERRSAEVMEAIEQGETVFMR